MRLVPVFKTRSLAFAALASAALVGTADANSSFAAAKIFTVALTGHAESNFAHPHGGTGDPNGNGLVKLTVIPARRQVCFDFRVSGLKEPVMAHIHRGAPLQIGPPVVTLFTGPGSNLTDCAPSTQSQLSDIVANPSDYYVSIDTTDYPDGALRGQL
ncbi:MAG: CHRD domain-containing protein [Sphingomicrobium sp.]